MNALAQCCCLVCGVFTPRLPYLNEALAYPPPKHRCSVGGDLLCNFYNP